MFKRVKQKPLTSIEELNLQIRNRNYSDATTLEPEKASELFSELMKIVKKTPGVIVGNPVEGKHYVSNVIRPKETRQKHFSFPEPNPVSLYYKSANQHLENADNNKAAFLAVDIRNVPQAYEEFCNFFEEVVKGIVFLLMTVEGFMNQLIEEGKTYQINGGERDKNHIEWMNFKDKLRYAIPVITGVDFYATNKPEYDQLNALDDLRNDLIHLKAIQAANFTNYEELFTRLINFNSLTASNNVFVFLNTVKPNYLEEA